MRGVSHDDDPRYEARILKGFCIAIGIFALCSLLLLIGPAGVILMVTFAPFAAGYYGGRTGAENSRWGWFYFGTSAGLLWSVVQSYVLLMVLTGVLGSADVLEPIGLSIIAAIFVSNTTFCVLGARSGAAARCAS